MGVDPAVPTRSRALPRAGGRFGGLGVIRKRLDQCGEAARHQGPASRRRAGPERAGGRRQVPRGRPALDEGTPSEANTAPSCEADSCSASRGRSAQARDHRLRYERFPPWGDPEAFRISSGSRPPPGLRNVHTSIQDHPGQARIAVDDAVGQGHHTLELAAGTTMNTGEKQALQDIGTRDDAAAGDHGGDRGAAPVLFIMNELGRRRHFGVGPEWPIAGVDVEFRLELGSGRCWRARRNRRCRHRASRGAVRNPS